MRRAALLAVLALLVGAAGAGGQSTPRLYVSVPLTGPLAPETKSMVKAIELAVADSGVGMDLVVLDDATKAAGGWDPAKVAANARRAAVDERAIAYIGEYNSGATAISLPLLNEAEILQVSPSNTYTGLTRPEAESPGEPEKYYPTGIRTFGRTAAGDHLMAAALAKAVAEDGRKRLFMIDDNEHYGDGIADMVRRRVKVRVVGASAYDVRARRFPALVRKIRRAKPDAILLGAITQNRAARVWRAMHRAAPRARLYGPDGLTGTRFPRSTRRLTHLMLPTLPQRQWLPAGRSFAERFAARFGQTARSSDLTAYEAARVILDGYAAGARDRRAVADAFFNTKDRESVFGRYSVDTNGDPTTARFGLYGVSRRGYLRFGRVVTVP